MMEIGTSIHAIAGFGKPGKPFRRAVSEIAECGFAHVMLLGSETGPPVDSSGDAPEAIVNLRDSDHAAMLRAIASHGLRVSCLYAGAGLDYSPEGAPDTIERLKPYKEIAWRLGCHVLVNNAGRAERPRLPHERKRDAIRRVADVMNATASDIPGEALKMAVDVHYGAIIETVTDCEYLLGVAGQSNAGLCLNMGHMTTLGEAGWTLLDRFPDRIHVLAWKDHLVGDALPKPVVSVELGKGKTPFVKYAEAYRKSSCRAFHLITFEDVPLEEKKGGLARSRGYLAGLLG
jgi:sugar phosphate isomerase/epimerase